MRLHDKLMTIPAEQVVAELDQMLERARVGISWWGERLVAVDGYEGSVTINELSRKYLNAAPLRRDNSPSLKERVDCYNLWGRVQGLYTQTDGKLKKMCAYRILVPLSEFRPWCRACAGDPLAIIGEWDFSSTRDSLFSFTVQDYKKLWPESEPSGKSWIMGGGESSEKWSATKEMVESALQKQIQ